MIQLSSAALAVKLDPEHGAEVLEVVHRRSGVQLLGTAPGPPQPPRAGDLDEETWTASYRGGWQIAAPNAGNACAVAGVEHGFHGRASVDPWQLIERDTARAVLRWSGHGLELVRVVSIADHTVAAELTWTAIDRPAPLVAVEHISFGAGLIDPEVVLTADAMAHELSEKDGPPWPPPTVARWPGNVRLTGEVERAERLTLATPRSRFVALTGFDRGRAELRNPTTGLGARVEWDVAQQPFAWLWQEVRSTAGIWRREAELLAIEPASVPHSLGLAEAITHGQALWATAGVHGGYRVSLTVTDA